MSKRQRDRSKPLLEQIKDAQLEQVSRREAERDSSLDQYYVHRERYVARALDYNDSCCIFVGPKGVGKSAILQMARLENSQDCKRIIDVQPDDLAFHALANIDTTTPLLSGKGRHQHLYKVLWDYVLTTAIARVEYKSTSNLLSYITSFLKPDERRLRRLLHKTFDDSGGQTKTFTQRMLDLVSEIKLTIPSSGIDASISLDSHELANDNLQTFSEISSIAKILTQPGALTNRYYVLIDDLDLHWDNTPLQNAFIGALLLSLRRLAHSPNIKFIVSLRDNIFESILIPEKDKVRDSVVRVLWDQQALRDMVEVRLATIVPSIRPHIWSDLYPRGAFERILNHTNHMPREVIRLAVLTLLHAKRDGSRSATNTHLDAALQEFSKERLSDLASLHRSMYPHLDRLLHHFSGKPPEFGYPLLVDLAIDLAIEIEKKTAEGQLISWAGGFQDDPLQLGRIFLECNFCQIKASRSATPVNYDPVNDHIDKDTWYAIHPMYRPSLNPRPTDR